IAYTPTPTPEP
ncbi:TPA_asm: UL17 uoORF, partial [Human alphaherpesvirus 1]